MLLDIQEQRIYAIRTGSSRPTCPADRKHPWPTSTTAIADGKRIDTGCNLAKLSP